MMYYFLAIVLKNHVLDGFMRPDYRLYYNSQSGLYEFIPDVSPPLHYHKVFFRNYLGNEDFLRDVHTFKTFDRNHDPHSKSFGPYFEVEPVGSYFFMACSRISMEYLPAKTAYFVGRIGDLFYDSRKKDLEKKYAQSLYYLTDLRNDKSYTAGYLNEDPYPAAYEKGSYNEYLRATEFN